MESIFFLSVVRPFLARTICIQCVQLTALFSDKCEKFTMFQATATNNDLDDGSIHAKAIVFVYVAELTFST